jgi:acyl-CoA thioester hydrolase
MIQAAKIQVRFTDLDVLGHVNNNVYLSYFEMARVHYFRELLGREWDWTHFTVVLAKNEVEYLKPVLLHHEPEVSMFAEHIGSKSFTLTYDLKVNGTVFATGRTILVAFDAKKGSSMEIHTEMRESLYKLEKSKI